MKHDHVDPYEHALISFPCCVSQEIAILEDVRAINQRKRSYHVQLLLEKTKLPAPAKVLITSGFLKAPPPVRRHAPSKFTLTEEYCDADGRIWTWAPYTGEAWSGSHR